MSTLKSNNENMTINADGASSEVKFQINGVEKASIDSSGNLAVSGAITGLAIGTDVQAYDADTAKTDTAQSFTEDQTFEAITETQTTKSASFTPDLTNDGTVYSCTSTMTITMPTAEAGKSFTIIHATATSITWSGTIKWNGGSAPTADSGIDIYVFISDGTNWYANQAGTGYA